MRKIRRVSRIREMSVWWRLQGGSGGTATLVWINNEDRGDAGLAGREQEAQRKAEKPVEGLHQRGYEDERRRGHRKLIRVEAEDSELRKGEEEESKNFELSCSGPLFGIG